MNKLIYIIIDVIFVAIVSLLTFTYSNLTPYCLYAYIFLLIGIFAQLIPAFIGDKFNDIAYKATLYTISIIYLILQIVVSFLGYMHIIEKGTLVLSLTCILLYLATVLIITIISKGGDSRKMKESSEAFFIEKIICELNSFKEKAQDEKTKVCFDEIIESARYSTISSCLEDGAIETEILNKIEVLKKLILSNRTTEIFNECNNLKSLLQKRNMLCELHKGEI